MKFPKHSCGLHLEHNAHRNVYEKVLDYCRDHYDWKNEEAKTRAQSTDELWTLQWYPDTPVGFNAVAAPTLEECLQYALEVESERTYKP